MKHLSLLVFVLNLGLNSFSQTCEWVNTFGGTYFDEPYDLITDYRGNIICIGRVNNNVNFNPQGVPYTFGSLNDECFVAKYDPSGVLVWARVFSSESSQGTNITTDNFGNIFVFGSFSGEMDFDPGPATEIRNAGGFKDGYLLKLNSFGDFEWVKIFQGVSEIPEGTGMTSQGLDIDVNGNLFLTGYFSGSIDFDPGLGIDVLTENGGNDFFVLKLDVNGDLVWLNHYQSEAGDWERSFDLKIGPLGGVHIIGSFGSELDFDAREGVAIRTSSGKSMFTLKLKNDGEFLWCSTIDGTITTIQPLNIEVGYDGAVYSSGNFKEEIDFDPSDGDDYLESSGWISLFIQKLNNEGEYEWTNLLNISDQGLNVIMKATPSGNLFVLGSFYGTIDMDSHPDDTFFLESNGNFDLFLADIAPDGSLVSANKIGGIEQEIARGIVMSNAGYFYITGSYSKTVDFDPSDGEILQTSNGNIDVFLAKISTYLSVEEPAGFQDFSLYPNPANEEITISCHTGDCIKIFDVTGQLIFETKMMEDFLYWDCSTIKRGMYLVNVIRENDLFTQKIILQ